MNAPCCFSVNNALNILVKGLDYCISIIYDIIICTINTICRNYRAGENIGEKFTWKEWWGNIWQMFI